MVQSLDQYVFIYETVMEALLCGQTTYPASTFGTTWRGIHKGEFMQQFEVILYPSNIQSTHYCMTMITIKWIG